MSVFWRPYCISVGTDTLSSYCISVGMEMPSNFSLMYVGTKARTIWKLNRSGAVFSFGFGGFNSFSFFSCSFLPKWPRPVSLDWTPIIPPPLPHMRVLAYFSNTPTGGSISYFVSLRVSFDFSTLKEIGISGEEAWRRWPNFIQISPVCSGELSPESMYTDIRRIHRPLQGNFR